jgi:hypothetical protein
MHESPQGWLLVLHFLQQALRVLLFGEGPPDAGAIQPCKKAVAMVATISVLIRPIIS